MSYKLYLDDYRIPLDSFKFMAPKIGDKNTVYLQSDWVVVKDYNSFVNCITERGIPSLVSFDHDLAQEHYAPENRWEDYDQWEKEQQFVEKTGKDCAEWLCNYCAHNNLKFPDYYVHSMNPVGASNITNLIESFKTFYEG